ncbi:MAG: alpha/beta fold hydrolase [Flavobacteriales bacterium]
MINSPTPLYFETHRCANENAPWLLFVHGAGGSTRTWRKQIEPCQSAFHVLLIDMPGHGNSREVTLNDLHYDFEWIANKIWQVVDLLRIQVINIAGVSLGSIIAMQMLHNRPQQVKAVVFAGPIVGLNLKLRLLARSGLTLAKVVGFQTFYAVTARLALPRKNHQKSREIFVRESKFLSDAEYRKWTSMYGKCLDRTLQLLFNTAPKVPMLLLVGTQDHLFMKPAIDYSKRFQSIQLTLVERCGHLVSLEKSEVFNGHLIDFLQKSNAPQVVI